MDTVIHSEQKYPSFCNRYVDSVLFKYPKDKYQIEVKKKSYDLGLSKRRYLVQKKSKNILTIFTYCYRDKHVSTFIEKSTLKDHYQCIQNDSLVHLWEHHFSKKYNEPLRWLALESSSFYLDRNVFGFVGCFGPVPTEALKKVMESIQSENMILLSDYLFSLNPELITASYIGFQYLIECKGYIPSDNQNKRLHKIGPRLYAKYYQGSLFDYKTLPIQKIWELPEFQSFFFFI